MINEETKTRLLTAYSSLNTFSKEEFLVDVNRIVLVAKIIDKWIKKRDCNYRLLINHIIIIENVFGTAGLFALYEYLEDHKECISSVLSVLYYLNKVERPAIYDVELYQKFFEELA